MLRRKLPDEIFDGRRTMPHLLFRKGDVAHHLANLDAALRRDRRASSATRARPTCSP